MYLRRKKIGIKIGKIAIKLTFFSFQSFSDSRRANVVNLLSSLKVYSLQTFPHNLHPNNTLFLNADNDDDEMYNPSLGVQSTYPRKMDLPTEINTTVEENIVLKLVQQKNDYINEVNKLTGNYKRSRELFLACENRKFKRNNIRFMFTDPANKKNKSNIYPKHLNKLMELTVQDPDPYFFGSYNWYYTGGTLETASILDIDFLFYVSGEKLDIFSEFISSVPKLETEKLTDCLFDRFSQIDFKQRSTEIGTFGQYIQSNL